MRSRSRATYKLVMFIASVAFVPRIAHADPWADHAQHLPSQERQIEILEGDIKELIEQKHATDDPAALKHIIDEMATKHKALVDAIEEHNAEVLHVRFKHPEKADIAALKLKNYQPKTLEQMENDFGVDGRLDKIKAHVLSTFPSAPVAKAQPEPPKISPLLRLPASEKFDGIDADDMPDKIKLSK